MKKIYNFFLRTVILVFVILFLGNGFCWAKQKDDKIVGNLGTGFFERSVCIFDYDNMIVYVR